MIPWLAFVVVALASYRLTRVVTTDTISEGFREAVERWAWDESVTVPCDCPDAARGSRGCACSSPRARWRTWVDGLVSCAWCAGFWITAATYSCWRWLDVAPVRAIIVIFALAGVQGFIASRHDA